MSATSVFETASGAEQKRRQRGRFTPRIPETVEGLGISQNTLVNLMLKMTMLEGERIYTHFVVGLQSVNSRLWSAPAHSTSCAMPFSARSGGA